MKNNNYFLLLIIALFILFGCSQGVYKDLGTGLKVSNKNLSYESAYLASDNTKVSSNEVEPGKKVAIVVEGVSGFHFENDKASIGASMLITDSEGKEILKYDDLFQNDSIGFSADDSKVLTESLTPGPPMESGKTYNWTGKFWDKKGDGFIDVSVELKIK